MTKEMREINKKGQVTIFIIIALLIASAVLIYFLFVEPNYVSNKVERLSGFDGCVQDALKGEIDKLAEKGGYVSPEFTYLYNGENIAYLCYTNFDYQPCIVQQPFLKQHFALNLKRVIADKINSCYSSSISDLKSKGYDVSAGTVTFDIDLQPGQIVLKIKAPTSISLDSEGKRFTSFESKIPGKIYDMLMISTSILQSETTYGDADTSSMMIFYSDYIIEKIRRSDGNKIYILTEKRTGTKFQFASRSFAWPAGYGFSKVGEQ